MQNKQHSGHPILDLVSPVVFCLFIANVLIFVYSSIDASLIHKFGLWPLARNGGRSRFELWQLISYGFLHTNLIHLAFNMFALWMFGTQLERLWGTRPFIVFYFVCLIGAGITQIWLGASRGFVVGASGAVLGLLMGYGMMYPNRKKLLNLPIPFAAKYFVIFYGLLELTLVITIQRHTIAHFTHLGGMFFGLLVILYWRGKLPIKPSRSSRLTR